MKKPIGYLLMCGAPEANWAFPVCEKSIVIGRDEECELRIVYPTVSRKHCEVSGDGTRIFARDLDSVNGTYINGNRIDRRQMGFGDILQVGPLLMQLVRAWSEKETVFAIDNDSEDTPRPNEPARTIALGTLNPIEMDIVRNLAEGLTEREAAEKLSMSQHSLHDYVKRLHHRLGVSSRAELIAWYFRGMAR